MTPDEEEAIRLVARLVLTPIEPSLAAVALRVRSAEKRRKFALRDERGRYVKNWPKHLRLVRASKGGRCGKGHKWTREEARAAAIKGVEARRRLGQIPG